jgi:hypothetical protein
VLGPWVKFASAETIEKALRYSGATDEQLSAHRKTMQQAGQGSSNIRLLTDRKDLLFTARHVRHCVQTFLPLSIATEFAEPANYLINYANITGYTCTSGLPNACSGARTGSANFKTSWWSNNTTIASIPGSTTRPPVAVKGVKQGATTITGRLDSPYCSTGTSGPITVKCFAQLKYRAVQIWIFEVGNHAYWWFQDGNGQNWVTDAGPTKNCLNTSLDCGFLNSWAKAGNKGQLPDDDAINNALAWQAQPSPSLCTNTGWLMDYQQQWRQNTTPCGKNKAWNSKTFAHSSGSNAIFTITTPPPNAPGW